MLIFAREAWGAHWRWAVFSAVAVCASFGWYSWDWWKLGPWPSGSAPSRLWLGVIGGSIILFEMLLWPRKKVRAWRIGRAILWMKMHIWLGLICLPILVIHGGFGFGGTLSAVLMVLLIIVIFSGVWGLGLQQILPRTMHEWVTAETIYSQIPFVLKHLREDAAVLVNTTCGTAEDAARASGEGDAERRPFLVVGKVREAGRVQGKVLQTEMPISVVAGSEPLLTIHKTLIDPFLAPTAPRSSALHSRHQSSILFAELKTKLDPAAHSVVDSLAQACEQRRQFDTQRRLHRWLHLWICVHLPVSIALTALMVVHAVLALKFR